MEISPSEYDLIVIGTGLQESLIAAAAAKQGKTVLHLDPASYYGSLWTSFQLDHFLDWCRSHGSGTSEPSTSTKQIPANSASPASAETQPRTQPVVTSISADASHGSAGQEVASAASTTAESGEHPSGSATQELTADGPQHTPAASAGSAGQQCFQHIPVNQNDNQYSHAEVHTAEDAELGASREYNIDLAPRVVHCAGSLIDALLDAGAQNYLEFKLLQQSYVWREGRYVRVPASRADIFKDRSLSPVDKRALMRFMQKAQHCFLGQPGAQLEASEAERSFVEMLKGEGLPQQLREVILYALACVPRGQEGPALTGRQVSTADGMAALARYMESVGRYGTDTAAFLVPLYGGGELPQAFCRVAAVAGTLYVLRQPVADVALTSAPDGRAVCTGVTTGSGQALSCKALAAGPGTLEALLPAESASAPAESAWHSQGVAILDGPLQEDESQVLAVFPPGAAGNAHPVYALQVGSATACAPAGRFLLYLSTPSTAPTAAQDLHPALEALVDTRGLSSSAASTSAAEGDKEPSGPDTRPRALLAAYYNRVAASSASALQHLPANVAMCDPPDASIGYEGVIKGAQALLQRLFPDLGEGLFPGAGNAGGDESDEEAIEALSEALGNLDVPSESNDKPN